MKNPILDLARNIAEGKGAHGEAGKGVKRCDGMYGAPPKIQIGKMTICDNGDGMMWIEDDKDGGEFVAADLEPFLREFYNKNF